MVTSLFDSILLGFKAPTHDENTRAGIAFCTHSTLEKLYQVTDMAQLTNSLNLASAPNIWSSYYEGYPMGNMKHRRSSMEECDESDSSSEPLFSPTPDQRHFSISSPIDLSAQDSIEKPIWFRGNIATFCVPPHSRFFVIKSFSALDIQASLLANLWASTEHGNRRLQKAFCDTPGGDIFLFFSVNGSMKFCGCAKMNSEVDFSSKADIWVDASRWKGVFTVEWLMEKEISNNCFRCLRVPQNENKPVTNSRDTQEIPFDVGILMLEIFSVNQ